MEGVQVIQGTPSKPLTGPTLFLNMWKVIRQEEPDATKAVLRMARPGKDGYIIKDLIPELECQPKEALDTPALLVDLDILQRNVERMAKTIVREGVPTEVSAFDVRAMLRAVELRDQHGGEVVVVTMGPPQAKDSLVQCLATGADRAVHLNDMAFAGSGWISIIRLSAPMATAALARSPTNRQAPEA